MNILLLLLYLIALCGLVTGTVTENEVCGKSDTVVTQTVVAICGRNPTGFT